MMLRSSVALLALALVVAGCSKKEGDSAAPGNGPLVAGKVEAAPPPAGKSWADVVDATPNDGMRMGNPNAAIKIVEYASFTCPHCKKFEDEGADALQQKYISTGKVSWEFRSTLIHGPDAPISLLVACRGAEPYFKLAQQLFASQEQWFGQGSIDKLTAQQERLQSLPTTDQFKATIEAMGLYSFFTARGLPRAQADKCLTDQKAIDRMTVAQQRYQTQDNVASTPTFLINGQVLPDVNTWEAMDARLASLTR